MASRLLHMCGLLGGTVGPFMLGAFLMRLFLLAIGMQELLVIQVLCKVLLCQITKRIGLLVGTLFLLIDSGVFEKEIVSLGQKLVLLFLVDV